MKNIDILVLSSILGTIILGSYVYYLSISTLLEKPVLSSVNDIFL